MRRDFTYPLPHLSYKLLCGYQRTISDFESLLGVSFSSNNLREKVDWNDFLLSGNKASAQLPLNLSDSLFVEENTEVSNFKSSLVEALQRNQSSEKTSSKISSTNAEEALRSVLKFLS